MDAIRRRDRNSLDEENFKDTRDLLREISPFELSEFYKDLCHECERLSHPIRSAPGRTEEEVKRYNHYSAVRCSIIRGDLKVFELLFEGVFNEIFPSFGVDFLTELPRYFCREYILITDTDQRNSVDVVSVETIVVTVWFQLQ